MSTETKLRVAAIALVCALIIGGVVIIYQHAINHHQRDQFQAIERRLALVETNATETLRLTHQSQADLGKIASAVLLWRMWLATNQTARTEP